MDCKEGHLIKTSKKADLNKYEKYKGTHYCRKQVKLLTMFLNRIKDPADHQLRDLAGFLRDQSYTDKIARLPMTFEKSVE